MSVDNSVLFDVPFIGDTRADRELSGDEVEALADEEIRGARIRLLRRTIERLGDGDSAAVALTTEFHPAPATRFTHATVMLRLEMPEASRVIEVAPTEVRTDEPVTFKISRVGKIFLEKVVKAEIGVTRETSYSVYPCVVRGSGAASKFATWSFSEVAQSGTGIGQNQDLVLTLAGASEYSAQITVSARLLKPGIAGALQRVRDLVLGPNLNENSIQFVTLTVPTENKRSGFFGFLR